LQEIIHFDLSNKQVCDLLSTDIKLKKIFLYIKTADIIIETDGFQCLTKYIIGQQISDKTREKIWQNLCNRYPNFTPNSIINVNNAELNSIGIPQHKISYIKNLANGIICKDIDIENFEKYTNEQIIKKLTQIKGIGKWTVEMYLIFSLKRRNVVATTDGTIRRVLKWMYNLETLPDKKETERYFKKWEENAIIVSAYFWKAIALNLTSTPFYKLI